MAGWLAGSWMKRCSSWKRFSCLHSILRTGPILQVVSQDEMEVGKKTENIISESSAFSRFETCRPQFQLTGCYNGVVRSSFNSTVWHFVCLSFRLYRSYDQTSKPIFIEFGTKMLFLWLDNFILRNKLAITSIFECARSIVKSVS